MITSDLLVSSRSTSTNGACHRSSGAQVIFGEQPLTIEDVIGVAEGTRDFALQDDDDYRAWIQKGASAIERKWRNEEGVYGVTTGVGESCIQRLPSELVPEFSRNLSRFHGCGLGRHFSPRLTAAILAVRLGCLARGYSAVRYELLERLTWMLNERIAPLIPEEGSVGASGDLTPLSYVAAFIMGERKGVYRGETLPASEIHRLTGQTPLILLPKEGLALMNGTSVMTALACDAWVRAQRLAALSTRLTSMVCEALRGRPEHFDPRIFQLKPHPGQMRCGERIYADLTECRRTPLTNGASRIQDTYALRCAPHIIGVLEDSLGWMRAFIETEINSSNDNPLLDPVSEDTLHGGNFYGGHIAMAMDSMKIAVANVADLMDRQVALLLNRHRNQGLAANLSGSSAHRRPINHAFKAIQISCSAWTAEALKNTTAASIFSRSTESHNQDKVSMGTIAARDALRVLELTEQVLAGALFTTAQALDLRVRGGEIPADGLGPGLRSLLEQVRTHTAFVEEDRPLEDELRSFLAALGNGEITCAWPASGEN